MIFWDLRWSPPMKNVKMLLLYQVYHVFILLDCISLIWKENERMCIPIWQQHKTQNLLLHRFIPKLNLNCFTLLYQLEACGLCQVVNQTLMQWHNGGLMKQMELQSFTSWESIFQLTIRLGQSNSKGCVH